jgi:hypothetical protein
MLKHIIPLILFFLLTPGILWTYSKKHNKYSIAILHAGVFAFVLYFIQSYTPIREGLQKIKEIKFDLEKEMKSKEVDDQLISISNFLKNRYKCNVKYNFKSKKGDNMLRVSIPGSTKGVGINKEDIMDPNVERITQFVDEIKNKE